MQKKIFENVKNIVVIHDLKCARLPQNNVIITEKLGLALGPPTELKGRATT